jgi:ribosomal protein S18 acetylase RimI-like enzyme
LQLEWKESLYGTDWDELSALYLAAPLGEKSPTDLKLSFTNSMFHIFVYDAGCLVGVGRALADGVDCSYLCDVAVLPSHQGDGLGKKIVTRLVALSAGHKKILLYTAPDNENFYRRHGFKKMMMAMAIFKNESSALELGLIDDN